ncbi:hypothetical protein F751_2621 [Auxenochlorella protothecoides]|uniref:Uncharacterized protein n=1 Tax=Auxenochlorella protothecoides TaxID=3075 RepID=A0A087SJ75_AUXPR|nr:hypothetical protein F751_2621 [Auxenochlorella protothecoides]KFM25779.1 hypothetical protein F751_2621 [Auxenochlorella protothecoides]
MPPGGDPPPPPPSPWQKVLYKEQPWPDNYTSPAFLESLVVNDRVPVRSYARVLAAATALMSPLYSTLTLSISSDTVLACVLGLALAHLYLADYRPASSGPAASLQGSLSLAAILAAAILVASRLRDVADVAAQLLLSLLAFAKINGPWDEAVPRLGQDMREA